MVKTSGNTYLVGKDIIYRIKTTKTEEDRLIIEGAEWRILCSALQWSSLLALLLALVSPIC